jgi:MFS family permease
MADGVPASPVSRPNAVLAMLLLVYIFNFLDRQILSILAKPIQADLGLDDAQLGLLGGLAFALLYSTLAVPLAWVADRYSRSWVIAISLTLWSGFTALCGFAQSFTQIFLARLGVGIGEAGGVAPSYALIGDYFPSNRRAFALSIYSLGIPLGSAAGVLAGGYIAALVDWRLAFLTVGLAGVLIAPLFKWVVRDRPKPVPSAGQRPARFVETARTLAAKRSFWLLAFGAAFSSMLGYGIAFWLPSLLQRSFGLDLIQTSWFFGALLLIGGVAGVITGGLLGDRMGGGDRAYYGYLPGVAFILGAPLFAAGVISSSATAAFLHLVRPEARSTASALFLLINNLIGLGGGIYLLGALSKALTPIYGAEALRYSILSSLVLYAVAAALMALAGPALRRDWVEE